MEIVAGTKQNTGTQWINSMEGQTQLKRELENLRTEGNTQTDKQRCTGNKTLDVPELQQAQNVPKDSLE